MGNYRQIGRYVSTNPALRAERVSKLMIDNVKSKSREVQVTRKVLHLRHTIKTRPWYPMNECSMNVLRLDS